ncbi:MAG: hypothetical protein HQL06_11180 [Nitrospirae bacterium]|nr:hypothetical protein [Nitrospirota bacterium]
MLTEKEIRILTSLGEDVAYENYFFQRAKNLKWFQPLKDKGYFSPKNNPKPEPADEKGPFTVPAWNVLSYLEKVSQQVNTPGNEGYIDELLKIIKDVSEYKDDTGQHIDNDRTWRYFVKILINLPTEKIPHGIIDLIPTWLESEIKIIASNLLPKFLNSDNPEDLQKAEKIVEIITDIIWSTLEEKVEPLAVVDLFSLYQDRYVSKSIVLVGEKCSTKTILSVADRLNEIFNRGWIDKSQEVEPNDYSYIWFPSLFSQEIYSHSVEFLLTGILRDMLLSKAEHKPVETREVLDIFLSKKYRYPLFKRLVLFIVGSKWEQYKDVFISMLERDNRIDYFNYKFYKSEMCELLETNQGKFTLDEKELLIRVIDESSQFIPPEYLDKQEVYTAFWKQRWYYPLKSVPEFKALYEEQQSITHAEEEGVSHRSWLPRLRVGPGPSPLSKEEIIRSTNEELAKELKDFKPDDKWETPTVGGFAKLLSEVARVEPEKFANDLTPFEQTGYIYVYELLTGIKDAWSAKEFIDWNKYWSNLFEFIDLYTRKEEFWNDEYIVKKGDWLGGADHRWVIGIIAELIQEGTREDSWAFPEKYLDKAKEIVFSLLTKLRKPEEDKEINDYVFHTDNSSCGKLITALAFLALRIARINKITADTKWLVEYTDKFDELLREDIIEAYTSLGLYLPYIYGLDSNWVKEKVTKVYDVKGSKYWEAFMVGYLYSGQVYYELMRSHYQYALTFDFKEKRCKELIIQHITVCYLRDYEELDQPDGLFRKAIDGQKPEQIKEIIEYFCMESENLIKNLDIKGKIMEFWRRLYEIYKGKIGKMETLTPEDVQTLSASSKMAVFLHNIDDKSVKWLNLSAPYVYEGFNYPFFIKNLDKLKDIGDPKQTARYIGDIYLEMLGKFIPDFNPEHIQSIVEFLYTSELIEEANRICNIYGKAGYHFLRQIYEKHMTKTLVLT